jgi:hypothetical protein
MYLKSYFPKTDCNFLKSERYVHLKLHLTASLWINTTLKFEYEKSVTFKLIISKRFLWFFRFPSDSKACDGVCVCVRARVYVELCKCGCVSVCVCWVTWFVCVCWSMWMHVLCVRVWVYVELCECVSECMCGNVWVCVYVCECVWVCAYVWIFVFVFVCLCESVCQCV